MNLNQTTSNIQRTNEREISSLLEYFSQRVHKIFEGYIEDSKNVQIDIPSVDNITTSTQ